MIRRLAYRLWWKIQFTTVGFWLSDVGNHLARIWYCHHNARVLVDTEYRLGCVLSYTTHTMSKPNYPLEAMYQEINDYHETISEEAVNDYKREVKDDLGIDLDDLYRNYDGEPFHDPYAESDRAG